MSGTSAVGVAAMILDWFRKPHLTVEVLGADIAVTMPGTGCRVVYTKTEDNKLVASTFSAPKVPRAKGEDHLREVSRSGPDSSQCEGQGDRLDQSLLGLSAKDDGAAQWRLSASRSLKWLSKKLTTGPYRGGPVVSSCS